jgi:septal ring factor EnvC (AmiA/AmiB activator)
MTENSAPPLPTYTGALNDVLHKLANFSNRIAETLASSRKDIEQIKAKQTDQEKAIKSLEERLEKLEAKARDV